MGELRHFGVARNTPAPVTASLSYLATGPDGSTFTVQLLTDRGQGIDRSSCSTTSQVFRCSTIQSDNGSNTHFYIHTSQWVREVVWGDQPELWGQVISKLCLRPSLASCERTAGQWYIALGAARSFSIELEPIWPGYKAFPTGVRGSPYQQSVGTPPELEQLGFTTSVTGLPQGLQYNAKYDTILGWASGMPGTTEVTIVLKSGDTVLTVGQRTITIENPQKRR